MAKWFIIELNEQYDGSYTGLENSILDLFGDKVEYFIPVHQEKMGSYTSTSTLFDGYVFVKESPIVMTCLPDLRDYHVFSRVLECCGRMQTVDSNAIGVMKRRLRKSIRKELDIGSKVKVLEGIFSNLVGEVVGVDDGGKKIMVKIKTLSREMIAPVPSTSIEEIAVESLDH